MVSKVVKASPFDGLMGIAPRKLPKSKSATVVVGGRKICDVRQLDELVDDDELERQRLKKQVMAARQSARYQRERENPQRMAARQAREEQTREERREYMRQYREKHREHINQVKREWMRAHAAAHREEQARKARERYQADIDRHREIARDSYRRNRDRILGRLADKREAERAQRDRQQAAQATFPKSFNREDNTP